MTAIPYGVTLLHGSGDTFVFCPYCGVRLSDVKDLATEPCPGDREKEHRPGYCMICDQPMPPGEEVFKYHGFSGPCPKPLPASPGDATGR